MGTEGNGAWRGGTAAEARRRGAVVPSQCSNLTARWPQPASPVHHPFRQQLYSPAGRLNPKHRHRGMPLQRLGHHLHSMTGMANDADTIISMSSQESLLLTVHTWCQGSYGLQVFCCNHQTGVRMLVLLLLVVVAAVTWSDHL